MRNLVLTIVTVVIIGILVDVILPDSEMKKYSKFAMGVIISLVIVSKILGLFTAVKTNNYDFSNFTIDDSYIEKSKNQQREITENAIEEYLKINDINCNVAIKIIDDEVSEIKVTKCNKANESSAKKLIQSLVTIEEGRIAFYE